MTIAHKGKGAENGKPVGSFYVNGSLNEPSIHEVGGIRNSKTTSGRRLPKVRERVYGLVKTNAVVPEQSVISALPPIEPDVPDETILVRWLEVEGPFMIRKHHSKKW